MGDDGIEGDALAAVAALTAAVDGLLSLPLTSLPGLGLIELTRLVEVQARRLPAFDHVLVAALASSGVYAEVGARNTATVLVQALRLSPSEAAGRVRAAKELGPQVDFTGGPMPPLYPLVAAAQAEGEISVAHARAVTTTVHKIPTAVRAEHGDAVEAFLVELAQQQSADRVAKAGTHALAVLDPDGTLASEEDQQRLRGLTIRANPDGSADLRGRLTPACAAVALAVLDPLAAPKPSTPTTAHGATASNATADADAADAACGGAGADAVSCGGAAAGTVPVPDPDPRSYPQRMHDALLDAGQRLLGSGTLPDSGGVPATVLVTMTLDQLESRLGVATTSHGGLITIPAALRLAADADIIPVVLGDGGGILAHGRSKRHATTKHRRVLAARDRGCSFPGCDAPPQWTQTHHIIPWAHGGCTDLANTTLLCGFHHRTHEAMGWDCHMINAIPMWSPPWWLDPTRTPIRNTTHHITDYLTEAA